MPGQSLPIRLGPSGNIRELTNFEGAIQMSNHHIQAALARSRTAFWRKRRPPGGLGKRASTGSGLTHPWPAGRRSAQSQTGCCQAGRQPRVMLRDGSAVLIRPVQGDDAPLLADGFARLSAKSRRSRFLTGKEELTTRKLRYLTEVDRHDHEALGALNHVDGRSVGIARYIRSADDPQTADVAVTVVDDWQGRGLAAAEPAV